MTANRIRERRSELGLTQQQLAVATEVSRQSLHAIESGRAVPSVAVALRAARALSCSVEALFGPDAEQSLEAQLVGAEAERKGARVIVGAVRDAWIAHTLSAQQPAPGQTAAHGLVRETLDGGRARIDVLRQPEALRQTFLVGGCAPALGVLADRLNEEPGAGRFHWLTQSNAVALGNLGAGHVHLAGVHLAEPQPARRARSLAAHLPVPRAAVFALATWEAGLCVPAGNPRRIRDADALANPRLRLAVRERGSGARNELDRLLKRAGASAAALSRRCFEVRSHMDVARAVSLGAADTGFTIRAAALAFGLDFLPLVLEDFDLVVPEDLLDDARTRRLLETVASGAFRRELEGLGYDARKSGAKVMEVART